MKQIQYPIMVFAVENPIDLHIVDLELFFNIKHAIGSVEQEEVNDGLYEVYDAEGRKLAFHTDKRNKVHLTCTEIVPTHLDRLEALLRFYLPFSDDQTDYALVDFTTLLKHAKIRHAYTPLRMPWTVIKDWLWKLLHHTIK